jgi:hypothetical protein
VLGSFAVIEQSAFALIKRLSAAPALKPLPPFPGLPVQDDISAADFAVFLTLWIGAEPPTLLSSLMISLDTFAAIRPTVSIKGDYQPKIRRNSLAYTLLIVL